MGTSRLLVGKGPAFPHPEGDEDDGCFTICYSPLMTQRVMSNRWMLAGEGGWDIKGHIHMGGARGTTALRVESSTRADWEFGVGRGLGPWWGHGGEVWFTR